MKDRIGNTLGVGDRVAVALPDASIFGFVAQIEESGLIAGVRAKDLQRQPGRVLVSCVLALPADYESGMVAQIVKVYDPDKVQPALQGEEKVM